MKFNKLKPKFDGCEAFTTRLIEMAFSTTTKNASQLIHNCPIPSFTLQRLNSRVKKNKFEQRKQAKVAKIKTLDTS